MEAGDWATWFGGVAAVLAVVVAAITLVVARLDDKAQKRLEIRGVSVHWRALDVPTGANSAGQSVSTYELTLTNPGRLPITAVDITITSPIQMTRVHYDGSREAASRQLTLDTPVVPAGGSRTWERRLAVLFAERDGMRDLDAVVEFTSLQAGNRRMSTRWGRGV